MKKQYIYVVFFICFFSCEEVINIDVPSSESKLVIDASISWFSGTEGNAQQIILSKTQPFFSTETIPASGATVFITDENNTIFPFIEEGATGVYKTETFKPKLNGAYRLNITFENQVYHAQETMMPVVAIDFIEQLDDGGFSGDEIEIKAFYTDPENPNNFYFFEFIDSVSAVPTLEVYDDEFTNGNQIFAFYTNEDIKAMDTLVINNFGVSKQFFEFMSVLLEQTQDNRGGGFDTQPASLRGNIINQTNSDDYPLGYFRVSQAHTFSYIIE